MSIPVLSPIDLEQLRELIKLMQESGLAEVEVKQGELSFRLCAKQAQPAVVAGQVFSVGDASPVAAGNGNGKPTVEEARKQITAPMVGMFYRAPSPEAAPFVHVGDVVKKGQVLCVIEAMKTMNQVEAEFDGRVADILVENAQAVEFGQPLFVFE